MIKSVLVLTRKELIEGGWIDKYVLGLTSEEESRQVEHLAALYPEVQDQINEARRRLCGNFNRKLTQPALRHSLISKRRTIYASAAVAILAVTGMIFLAIRHHYLKCDYTAKNERLEAKLSQLSFVSQHFAERTQFINASTTKRIKLKGCESLPDAEVLVYQCRAKGKMMLEVIDLPALPQGGHYEVWASHPGLPDKKIGELVPPIRFDSLYILDTAMEYSLLQITKVDPELQVTEAICLAKIR